MVKEKKGNEPLCTADYRDVLAIEAIDAVIVATSWADHLPIVIAAMKAGKYVATEVGGAYSVDECWELVRTPEETGVPCMMLESCCYDRRELVVLHMVTQGSCGEVGPARPSTARAATATTSGTRFPSAGKTAITAWSTT